jgi:CRP/FNR family transcriptional regulator
MLLLLTNKNAQERLAAFLINFSGRLRKRGLCATDFSLSMRRPDIANYLGLSAETVSRGFTHLQKRGLLSVERKHVGLVVRAAAAIRRIDGSLALARHHAGRASRVSHCRF